MNFTDKSTTYKRLISGFIWMSVPMLGVLVLSAVSRMAFWNVSLTAGKANDEMFYFKQIQAMIDYNVPQGYFCYNEVPPLIGSMGAWVPLIYIPYFVFGKIFGWSYASPLIANMIFACIGFFFWGYFVETEKRTKLLIVLSYVCMFFYSKCIMSGMVEALFFMLVIMFLAILLSDLPYNKKYIYILIIASISTIIRPYFLLMYIPIFIMGEAKERENIKKILAIVLMFVSAVLYFVICHYFCAPYFSSGIIDTVYLSEIESNGVGSALMMLLADTCECFRQCFETMVQYISGDNMYTVVGEKYTIVFIQAIAYVAIIIRSIFIKNKKRIIYCAAALFANFALLFAIMVLYDVYGESNRHLMSLILFNMLLILKLLDKSKVYSYVIGAGMVVLAVISYRNTPYSYSNYDPDRIIQRDIDYRTDQFAKIMELSPGVSWENDVVFVFPGDDFRVFYSLPSGFGITICQPYFLADNDTKSRYIIDKPGAERVFDGYVEIYQDEKCVLYEKEK